MVVKAYFLLLIVVLSGTQGNVINRLDFEELENNAESLLQGMLKNVFTTTALVCKKKTEDVLSVTERGDFQEFIVRRAGTWCIELTAPKCHMTCNPPYRKCDHQFAWLNYKDRIECHKKYFQCVTENCSKDE